MSYKSIVVSQYNCLYVCKGLRASSFLEGLNFCFYITRSSNRDWKRKPFSYYLELFMKSYCFCIKSLIFFVFLKLSLIHIALPNNFVFSRPHRPKLLHMLSTLVNSHRNDFLKICRRFVYSFPLKLPFSEC